MGKSKALLSSQVIPLPSNKCHYANDSRCVERVLRLVAEGWVELMVASHNQASVAAAATAMRRLGLQPSTSGAPPPQLPC